MTIWSRTNKELEVLIEDIKDKFRLIAEHLDPHDAGEIWYEKKQVDMLIGELNHFKELLIRYRDLGKRIGRDEEASRLTELVRILSKMKPSAEWVKTVRSYFSILRVELEENKSAVEAADSQQRFLVGTSSDDLNVYDITSMKLYFSQINETSISVHEDPTNPCTIGCIAYESAGEYSYYDGEYNRTDASFQPRLKRKLHKTDLITPGFRSNHVHHPEFFFTSKQLSRHAKSLKGKPKVFKEKEPYYRNLLRCKCGKTSDLIRHRCEKCNAYLFGGLNVQNDVRLNNMAVSISVGFNPVGFGSFGIIQAAFLMFALNRGNTSPAKARSSPFFPESEHTVKKHYLHYVQKLFELALRKYGPIDGDHLSIEATFTIEELNSVASYLPFKSRPGLAVFLINLLNFLNLATRNNESQLYSTIKHELTHHLRTYQHNARRNVTVSLSQAGKRADKRLSTMAKFHLFVNDYIEEGLAVFAQGASSNLSKPIKTHILVDFENELMHLFLDPKLSYTDRENLEYQLLYEEAQGMIVVAFARFTIENKLDENLQITGAKKSYGKLESNGHDYALKNVSKAFKIEGMLSLRSAPGDTTRRFLEYIRNWNSTQLITYIEEAFSMLDIPEKFLTLSNKLEKKVLTMIHLTYSTVTCQKCHAQNNMLSRTCRNCTGRLDFDPRFLCKKCKKPLDITFVFCPYCQQNQFSETNEYRDHRQSFRNLAA